MKADRVDKFLTKALVHMFKCVGEKYTEKFTKQPDWYTLHTWNTKQERAYRAWFVKHIMKDLTVSKKRAEDQYSYYMLMWGWPVSNDANVPKVKQAAK